MKKIDWFSVGIVFILAIMLGGLTYGIIECYNSKDKPLESKECSQKTLQYIGFDGKKHQAIVIKTQANFWVLVERK